MWRFAVLTLLALGVAGPLHAAEQGLLAHWDFRDESGQVLHDRSGHGQDGTIHGATWQGRSLHFGAAGDYVDCGTALMGQLKGDFTIAVWMKLAAEPFPDESTNWHIIGGEKYQVSGVGMRIDGTTTQLYLRTNQAGTFSDLLSNGPLRNGTRYHLVLVKHGDQGRYFIDCRPDKTSTLRDPAPGDSHFLISEPSQPFRGTIEDVRVYGEALSISQIRDLYVQGAEDFGVKVPWAGRLTVTPFLYRDDGQAVLRVNVLGVLPLGTDEQLVAQLRRDDQVVRSVPITVPESGIGEVTVPLDAAAGQYQLRVAVMRGNVARAEQSFPFSQPPQVDVPSPDQSAAAPLPAPVVPPRFDVQVDPGGGFHVIFAGQSYGFESSWSYPQGGDNRLVAADQVDRTGQREWHVQAAQVNDHAWRVIASGTFYRVERELTVTPTHVQVRDRIVNIRRQELGLILSNHLVVSDHPRLEPFSTASVNPLIFMHEDGRGIGLAALDDVYLLQQQKFNNRKAAGFRDEHFGLPPEGQYTLEWAVYPTASEDYYDFLNAVRADQGLSGRTIDGCLAITQSGNWMRNAPPRGLVDYGGIHIASTGCLAKIADDPEIELEGFEFIDYPKQCAELRENYVHTKKQYPGIKVMFHVAPSLCTTNKPQHYADARVIDIGGKHTHYGNPVGFYFSQQRVDQGFAWYPFYPTLSNSFGKAMLHSVDVMMDDIGVDGVFADGLVWGYGGLFTYDRWDGHTVDIDPSAKTIVRKMASVVLLGRDAYLAYVKKILARGGTVYSNGGPGPAAIRRENVMYCTETATGDMRCSELDLAPTVIGLGDPVLSDSQQGMFDDVRGKLQWGALFAFYCGTGDPLTHDFITRYMYPITVDSIHSGVVRGRQRIITSVAGVYGWPGDHDLHQVFLSDARGRMTPCSFISTADPSGVRTTVDLRDQEIAVVRKIPVHIEAGQPVNVLVQRFEPQAVEMVLNGAGPVQLQLRELPDGARYSVNGAAPTVAAGGAIACSLQLTGPQRVSIVRQ